jgi:hypothetical protein
VDWSAVIVGGLAFLGTLAGAYMANKKQTAIWAYRLEELEKKVDKHNQVIERTYELESRADVMDEQIKVANHRIADLEAKK